jgi:hypothetical protein
MLDYTALDFETANAYRGSPCAVGLVRVRDGRPVDEQRWLIHPPAKVDYFDGLGFRSSKKRPVFGRFRGSGSAKGKFPAVFADSGAR